MSLVLFLTHSGDIHKRGLMRAVSDIRERSELLPKPTSPDDPALDVYIYISGNNWRHERNGFKLGSLSERSRSWQRVMIYVPDELVDEDEGRVYFSETFEAVAKQLEVKLRVRRPEWPIDVLVRELRSLKPSLPTH